MGQSAMEDPVGGHSRILFQSAKHAVLTLPWRLQVFPKLRHLSGVLPWVQIDSFLQKRSWGSITTFCFVCVRNIISDGFSPHFQL